MKADFEAMLSELSSNGELVGGEALGDPASSRLYRWETASRWPPTARTPRPRSTSPASS